LGLQRSVEQAVSAAFSLLFPSSFPLCSDLSCFCFSCLPCVPTVLYGLFFAVPVFAMFPLFLLEFLLFAGFLAVTSCFSLSNLCVLCIYFLVLHLYARSVDLIASSVFAVERASVVLSVFRSPLPRVFTSMPILFPCFVPIAFVLHVCACVYLCVRQYILCFMCYLSCYY
jgi:hypothetical protein